MSTLSAKVEDFILKPTQEGLASEAEKAARRYVLKYLYYTTRLLAEKTTTSQQKQAKDKEGNMTSSIVGRSKTLHRTGTAEGCGVCPTCQLGTNRYNAKVKRAVRESVQESVGFDQFEQVF
ncbi:hypothetical protein CHS0354_020628 [Potamilus streckersoni]|uniref:Uncharacterized protein n=1 Tax=Potamilus streckersoni TaxID=2493646 RepID=A0AAE0T2Z9_9BIVA|nr:hypothetical protein CHS0354_020628 [Potamilus streckersoni]